MLVFFLEIFGQKYKFETQFNKFFMNFFLEVNLKIILVLGFYLTIN